MLSASVTEGSRVPRMPRMQFLDFKSKLPSHELFQGKTDVKLVLGDILNQLGANNDDRAEILNTARSWARISSRAGTSTARRLIEGTVDAEYAIAFYYWLHIEMQNTDYPGKVDVLVFGESFHKKFGYYVNDKPDNLGASHGVLQKRSVLAPLVTVEPDENEENWLNPYNLKSISLEGREAQLQMLRAFAKSNDSCLMWTIVGASGSGKTRLASQWMNELRNDGDWEVGFLCERDPDVWNEWKPRKNTVITIDYIFKYNRCVSGLIEYLLKKNHLRNWEHKVRVLILDHVYPESFRDLIEDPVWGEILVDRKTLDESVTLFFEKLPMRLDGDGNSFDDLKKIIARVSKLKSPDDPRIEEGLRSLRNMGEHARHPLFAALIGDTIKRKIPNNRINRRDLIDYYFTSINRFSWKQRHKSHFDAGTYSARMWAGSIVSLATIQATIEKESLYYCLPTDVDREKVYAMCERLVSAQDQEEIFGMKPDLFGETFFVNLLSAARRDARLMETFERLLSCKFILRDSRSVYFVNILEFFIRCCRNLSQDLNEGETYREFWAALLALLDSKIQVFGFGTVFEVVKIHTAEIIEEAGHHKLAQKFWSSVKLSRVSDATENDIDFYTLRAVNYYYNHMINQTREMTEGEKENFVRAITIIVEGAAHGYDALVGISLLGNSDLFDITVEVLGGKLNVNKPSTSNGFTALMAASQEGYTRIVEKLFHLNANPNLQTLDTGWTALLAASSEGHDQVVRLLLDKGADPHHPKTDDGTTSLMAACRFGHFDCVKMLIGDRRSIDARQFGDGWTALIYACQEGYVHTVDVLLKNGANPNPTGVELGWTPLMAAAYAGHRDVVLRLLDGGADRMAKYEKDGSTAADLATSAGYTGIARLLNGEEA